MDCSSTVDPRKYHAMDAFRRNLSPRLKLTCWKKTLRFKRTFQILEDIGIESVTRADCESVAYVCRLISTRAAHLTAAGIATLLNRMGRRDVTVGVDGSVYRFHPTFRVLLNEKIRQLIDIDIEYEMILSEDGSGRGAAVVAAVASRMKQQQQQ
ncbi:hypothetical protein KIN20_020830 [Parelaphostrongylus tenuis]|uniref:Phosphotransferase n=1 Tax=Parelaphostrongylus tenuis TaxID=148309 RepID=A0AAD5MRU3_PARTN|nr:hypothetical protein KIN20_020830 [Parelaphostrongylus tenuis]